MVIDDDMIPKRKPNRLKGYDYSQSGLYFVTVCVKDRKNLLGKIVWDDDHIVPRIVKLENAGDDNIILNDEKRKTVGDDAHGVPRVALSNEGIIVDECIRRTNEVYESVTVEKYVIMPNHIHLIIVISKDNGTSRAASPTKDIPTIISTFKHLTNKRCGFPLWQRSYHDRIIRNEQECRKIWDYIDTNPVLWENDCFYNE